ncbi:MAG: ABC transporter permease, partial [Candidatus Kerfeldbacteria bacterium]|nr:ABC transporter permease [Candidatus Kerfeldbacteria bacterium]
HILITPTLESKQPYIRLESSVRKKIELVPGVTGSSSTINFAGTVSGKNRQVGARIEALLPSEDMQVTTIHTKIVKGEYLADGDDDQVVLGEIIAGRKIEDLIGRETSFGTSVEGLGGVDVGEKVKIIFPNGVTKEYRVKGIASSQGFGVVSQTVYMSKKEAESVLGLSDQASQIRVRLADKNHADRYKNLILDLGIPSANIRTWKEASSFVEGINQTFGVVIVVTTIVGIIIVMATIGIVVFINTSRKKRIIGVLKAIGMQKNDIMLVFLAESLLFGIIGTLIGLAIVYGSLFYFSENPIALPIGQLTPALPIETAASSIIIIIAASVAAGYIPAKMASRQEILETIRVVE